MTTDRPPEPAGPPAGVRTTRRRGRTSPAKEAALANLGPRWCLTPDQTRTKHERSVAFGRSGPTLIDVGVGNGEATRAWATDHPEALVIAIELHRPGLAKLLTDLEADGPANVRVVEADALLVLGQLEPGTVHAIRVLFPDPWPKRRHVGRRMVDRPFARAVAEALVPGGALHLATDSDDYATHMRTMLATEPRLEAEAVTERPDRPITTYEHRGILSGRTITDLRYRRRCDG